MEMRRSTFFPQLGGPPEDGLAYDALTSARIVDQTETAVRLQTAEARVEVTALAPDLFRIGMFADGRPISYRSEAVAKQNWPPLETHVGVTPSASRIQMGSVVAQISLDPLRIVFRDGGREFAADDDVLGMGSAPMGPRGALLPDPIGAPSVV